MTKIVGSDIKFLATRYDKEKNNFERARDLMDIMDMSIGDYRDYDEIEKFNINYELFNGRLDVKLYDDPVCLNIDGEEVKFEYNTITHFPLISQVANAMHGEIIQRPFAPMAIDMGTVAQTLRKKKWNELLREFLTSSVVTPLRDEVTSNYFREFGITNQFELNPEEIKQAEADIRNRTAAKTPKEIMSFMQNDFQTPTQRQAQQLLDYYILQGDIKAKQEEGFKHALITAKEIYHIGERHGEPIFELINPKYFMWSGSQNTEWVQDGTWAKYEQWLTLEDALQRYAEHFKRKDYKEILDFAEPIGGKVHGPGDPRRDSVLANTMYELSVEDGWAVKKYGDINYKTKAGQKRIVDLYSDVVQRYGHKYGEAFNRYGIRVAHFAWRDKTKMKRVTRIEDDKKVNYWQGAHYEPQPHDYEILDVWVDEIWQGTKVGATNSNDIYVDIGPSKGQYKSIFNPYGVKLPYYGKYYNTHMNNAKNVSIIDLGKPWQKEFDTTMTMIKHDLATDIGKVFLMSLDLKPENWTWQNWFTTMINSKMLMTNVKKHGYTGLDLNNFKSVDLSRAADIDNKINLLNYYRENLIAAMNFNPTRIGAIGEYTTNRNIVASQSASYNQTEGYFETHRQIVEKALNAFMNKARQLFKKNPRRFFVLDDVARVDLELSPEFWFEEWAVKFSTSTEEIQRVSELREQLQSFVQNGLSFNGAVQLSLAKTPADMINLMKEEQVLLDQRRQEEVQLQQQAQERELQMELEKERGKQEFELFKQREQLSSQERRVLIDSEKFANAQDIDRNKVADQLQKTAMELAFKKQIEDEKLKIQKEELKLKEKEIEVKEKDLKQKREKPKSKD